MIESRTRTHLTLLAVCLLPFANGCADPAADAPQAVVEESKPPVEMAPADRGESYAMTTGSSVGFVGSKVTGTHEGGFESFTGTVWLGEDGPASSSIEVVIDTTSLWADNERLTGHLKSADFFDVETFPTATFSSTSIEAAEDGSFTVTGDLDLHGVTKQIAFPASIDIGDDEIRASAEFAVKRFDFGIVYPGKAEDLIRDDVLVKLDLVAAPAG